MGPKTSFSQSDKSKALEADLLSTIASLEAQARNLERDMEVSQGREKAHIEYEQALRKRLAAEQASMRARVESNKRLVAVLAETEATQRDIDEAEEQSKKEAEKEIAVAEEKIAAVTLDVELKKLCDNLYAKED